MKKYRVTFYGNQGTVYSYILELDESDELDVGDWKPPFPNTPEDSTAFGLEECLRQNYGADIFFDEVTLMISVVEYHDGDDVVLINISEGEAW